MSESPSTTPTSADSSGVPSASEFTSSPLRNRIRVELRAPASEVWALVGDLTRFPEYSVGLDTVEATLDSSGMCTEFLCHFKPREEGGASIDHRELVRWYEPNRGFASLAEEPNAFGLTDSLTLVILEPSKAGTLVTWDQHYEAEDLDMMRAEEFDPALVDQAENLIARFGGMIIDRYVEQ